MRNVSFTRGRKNERIRETMRKNNLRDILCKKAKLRPWFHGSGKRICDNQNVLPVKYMKFLEES